MTATVALQIVDVLREFGVDRVFGIPGGAISAFYAALLERPDVQIVTAKHETGAAFMAMGYALATGRPGVVVTTAGPGITNALTGVASANYEGLPLVLIAGEVPRSSFGRGALQEGSSASFDAVTLVRRFVKFAVQLSQAGPAAAQVRKALVTAYSGRRGAVFVSLPLDVAATPQAAHEIAGTVRSTFDVDEGACARALELLEHAQRPLILCGSGAREPTSRRALVRLAEHLQAPVAVTTKAKSVFPEEHPLYLGLFGFGGHDSVTDYLASGVDVLLVCASGLNDFETNAWSPALRPLRAFVQIDIDSAQFGRNYPVDIGLLGPADAVIGRMLDRRAELLPPRPPLGLAGPRYQPLVPSARGMLTTAEVVACCNEVCPAQSVFTADMGEHLAVALHYLRVRDGGDFFTPLGFGSMGSGICAAIGYQLGAPRRRTFALCGDGGFLMHGNELATAVQHAAPTTFLVMNDARLNMVHHGMRALYGATPDFGTQTIDFAAMAHAMGAAGHVVRTRPELEALLAEPAQGPVVLDVRIDPDVRLTGSQRNAALRQFQEGDEPRADAPRRLP
ncbi:MAG: thiamine pyrophosphate-binding protein [Polyangiaceae bacterium]|nr:thiamine pyrophosphate-binding protein [Polyangiaceae bacterium]